MLQMGGDTFKMDEKGGIAVDITSFCTQDQKRLISAVQMNGPNVTNLFDLKHFNPTWSLL